MKPNKLLARFLVLFFTLFFCLACEKEAGEGGTSTIMGRVKVKNYNSDFTILFMEMTVFIPMISKQESTAGTGLII